MTAPDPHSEPEDSAEPRFAGPVFAGAKADRPASEPPAVPVELPPIPPAPQDPYRPLGELGQPAGPIVSYDSEPAPESLERKEFAPSWAPATLAIVGGVLVVCAGFLTWVTLRIEALNSAAASVNDGTPNVTYGGYSLLEGRAMLLLAVAAIVLAILRLLRRLPARGTAMALAGIGAVGFVVMAFTALDRPSSLATLFRSYETVDAIRVHLPNGPGIWLAMAGSLMILIGGLAGLAERRFSEPPPTAG